MDTHRGIVTEIDEIPDGCRRRGHIGKSVGLINAFHLAALQVLEKEGESYLALTKHKVIDLRKILILAEEERPAGHDLDAGLVTTFD